MNAIAKKQNSPRPLLPRLRFAEFRGEWKQSKLGDCAVIVRGGSPRPIDDFLTTASDGLNWLKIGDVDKNAKYVTQTQEKIIHAALNKTREVNPGDLILSNSMSFGRPYIMKIKSCIHDGWIAVTNLSKRLQRDYLFYLMMTDGSQSFFSENAAGSGVQNLNADIIKLLPVLLPDDLEQQKIAACLSSLDTLITAEAQKLDTLKTHKKGLMQQLFPRAGETTPRLRFAEFRGEWESVPLGSLGKFFRGLTYGSNDVADGGLLVLRSSNIQGGRLILDSDLVFVAKQCPSDLRLRRGDVVICMSNGSKALVGKSAELDRDYSGELTVGAFCSIFRPLIHFAKIAFDTQQYADFVSIGIAGGNINNLKNSDLEAFEFHIPQEEAEQQKIAACLSSLDELITAQAQKVAALQTHKKGLMQQLFPVQSEASA